MKFSNILVPIKGHAVDEDAIQLACAIARQQKAKVWAIYVIELRRSLPLDVESAPEIQHGEQILDRADQVANAMGVQIETELVQARVVGPVLMDEAAERNIDLIVMGIPYRPPLDDFHIGEAVRHVLKHATCRVWLCREKATGEPKASK